MPLLALLVRHMCSLRTVDVLNKDVHMYPHFKENCLSHPYFLLIWPCDQLNICNWAVGGIGIVVSICVQGS